MRYLLDTCAIVWLGMGGGPLTAAAKRRISVATTLHYSSISAWEIARLQKEGKIVLPKSTAEFLKDMAEEYGIDSIPPTDDIMAKAADLPDIHKDPADRIIIATAIAEGMPIITGDAKLALYGVATFC